jgi:hypothetical protein
MFFPVWVLVFSVLTKVGAGPVEKRFSLNRYCHLNFKSSLKVELTELSF